MKKLLLPASVFFLGLFITDYLFVLNVRKLFEGFINVIVGTIRAAKE